MSDFAHGVWTALAITLAQPLRDVLDSHVRVCDQCPVHGIARCDEGYQLWLLLPEGDRVVVG